MVRTLKPTLIVETGTCWGYVTAFLAKGMLDCGSGGKVVSIDYYQEDYPHARSDSRKTVEENLARCGADKCVELVHGEALGTLKAMSRSGLLKNLGIAIFDDTHSFKQVAAEIAVCYPHLVPLGIVGGHDTYNADMPGPGQAFRDAADRLGAWQLWSHQSSGYTLLQKPASHGPLETETPASSAAASIG
jgi:cephalosporin hydroxylase